MYSLTYQSRHWLPGSPCVPQSLTGPSWLAYPAPNPELSSPGGRMGDVLTCVIRPFWLPLGLLARAAGSSLPISHHMGAQGHGIFVVSPCLCLCPCLCSPRYLQCPPPSTTPRSSRGPFPSYFFSSFIHLLVFEKFQPRIVELSKQLTLLASNSSSLTLENIRFQQEGNLSEPCRGEICRLIDPDF